MLRRKTVGKVLFSGFHGTNISSASEIMSSRKFILSNSKNDWLGPGIYFYYTFNDAWNWRDSDAVVLAILRVDEKNILDLDTDEGKEALSEAENHLCKKLNITLDKDAEQNQCSIAKVIWDSKPQLELMTASFAVTKRAHKTLIDTRKRRKEFCIRNNTPIKYLHMIKKGDVNE